MTSVYTLAAAAHDAADKAWQAAMVAAYGAGAQDARYDERGRSTPLLRALHAMKRAAAEAESAAFDARPRD